MFVGELDDNLAAVKVVLESTDPLEEHLDNVLTKCDVLSQPHRFIAPQPYESVICEGMPSVCCGYVYMVVSKRCSKYLVKECIDLKSDMLELNSIMKTSETAFQPWLLACYIVGFKGSGNENQN